jgi:TolB-like protein
MPFNKKLIFFLSLVLFISFFTTHYCFAATYEWKDFTKPFKLGKYMISSTNPLTINVYIPAEVLKKFAKLPLILKGKGASYWPDSTITLRINDSTWAVYQLPRIIPAIHTINIKTKHLKPGINKLRFIRNLNTSFYDGDLIIYSLQFNIKKAAENRKEKIQTQPITKTSKPPQPITGTSKSPSLTIAEKDKFKIAVMEFKSLNAGTKNTTLGSMIAEMFTTEVVNSNSFKIVEREQLNKILGELRIGQSGVLDTTDAQKLGKILGAGAIITGSVMKMGDSLRIDSRIIEVETGIIVSAERRICKENLTDISRNIADMTTALAHKFYKKK